MASTFAFVFDGVICYLGCVTWLVALGLRFLEFMVCLFPGQYASSMWVRFYSNAVFNSFVTQEYVIKSLARDTWDPVIDRIKKKLVVWKSRYISTGGRLALIKSLLASGGVTTKIAEFRFRSFQTWFFAMEIVYRQVFRCEISFRVVGTSSKGYR